MEHEPTVFANKYDVQQGRVLGQVRNRFLFLPYHKPPRTVTE